MRIFKTLDATQLIVCMKKPNIYYWTGISSDRQFLPSSSIFDFNAVLSNNETESTKPNPSPKRRDKINTFFAALGSSVSETVSARLVLKWKRQFCSSCHQWQPSLADRWKRRKRPKRIPLYYFLFLPILFGLRFWEVIQKCWRLSRHWAHREALALRSEPIVHVMPDWL